MFMIPDIVARNIIKLEVKFFWGFSDKKRSLMTVKCESLEAPKALGRLVLEMYIKRTLAYCQNCGGSILKKPTHCGREWL